jgi:zinc transporter
MTTRFAYDIQPDGQCILVQATNTQAHLEDERTLTWVHLSLEDALETESWIQDCATFLDPLIVQALLAPSTRPRVEELGETGMLVIMRGMNTNEGEDPEDMVSLRLWVDHSRIISLEKHPLKAVNQLCKRLERGGTIKSAGDFMAHLLHGLFLGMEPYIMEVAEQMDGAEEQLALQRNTLKRRDLNLLRRKAIIFRRFLLPQKDVVEYIRINDVPWLSNANKRQLKETVDRIQRYIEEVDAVRERAHIAKDELSQAISEHLNKNLYAVSLVTMVFLPLTFITGLLGMNVQGIPGAEHPLAFWGVCALCALLVVGFILLLKRLRWM